MNEDTDGGRTLEIPGDEPLLEEEFYINKEVDNGFWTRKEEAVWGTALNVMTALIIACRNCLPISAVAMSKEFNWNKSDTGLILSSFYWGYPTTQILSGYLSDRFGGDQVATIAGIGWGLLTLLFPFCAYAFDDKSSQIILLVIVRVLYGMVQGFHFPIIASLTAMRVQNGRRNFFYTANGIGLKIGICASGSLGSYLLFKYDWQLNFYVCGIISIIWALVIRVCLMRKRCIQQCRSIQRVNESENNLTHGEVWKTLVRHRSFWAMIFVYFCGNYAWHSLFSWLPTFFEETFPEAKGWVFNTVPWIFPIFTGVASGYIADRLISSGMSKTHTRKVMETLATLTYVTSLMLLGHMTCFVSTLAMLTFAWTVGALGAAGAYANNQDLAPAHAGTVYGVMNAFGALPGAFGTYIDGYILEYFDSWNIVFSLTGSIMFVGWIGYVLFGTGKRIV
ncbi:voltage-gated purine nucleotide uniporter SLC17A9-like [Glandiceps talaboti]